jgi:hypothetical protein
MCDILFFYHGYSQQDLLKLSFKKKKDLLKLNCGSVVCMMPPLNGLCKIACMMLSGGPHDDVVGVEPEGVSCINLGIQGCCLHDNCSYTG